MINRAIDLGVMALMESMGVLKMIPKPLLSKVLRRLSHHYVHSGKYLRVAMRYAIEQSFAALDFGLRPNVWGKLFQSQSAKEFVKSFNNSYLEPYLDEYRISERARFCAECSLSCRRIAKRTEHLVEELVLREEDVHEFLSNRYVIKTEQKISESEAELFSHIKAIEGVSGSFLALMSYKRLLFEAIQYFFRQELIAEPAVKNMMDDLRQIEHLKIAEATHAKLASLESEICSIDRLLWGGFERQMGSVCAEMQQEFSSLREQMMLRISDLDAHLDYQDRILGEVLSTLRELRPQDINQSCLNLHRSESPQGEIEPPLGHRALVRPLSEHSSDPAEDAQHEAQRFSVALLGANEQILSVSYIYFAEHLRVGRYSQNDLILHWLPLPSPPDRDNPEWRNWLNTGKCHPSLLISGFHCELRWLGDALRCIDRSSRGTGIDGKILRRGESRILHDGAILSLAGVLSLGYSLLRDPMGNLLGWSLRRLDNAPESEEYIFLLPNKQLQLGRDLQIANPEYNAPTCDMALRRNKSDLVLIPLSLDVQCHNRALRPEIAIASDIHIHIREQSFICNKLA